MIVSMWMTKKVARIEPQTPLSEVATLMANMKIRHLPVIGKSPAGLPAVVGIVSQSDLLHAYPPNVNPFANPGFTSSLIAADIMSRNLHTTTPEAPIEEAAELMRQHKIGALPVIHNGELTGLITEYDIFRAFADLFEKIPGSARITFDISRGDDVFALLAQIAQRRQVQVHSLTTMHRDNQPICVARITGKGVEQMLEDIWKTGHPVLSVVRQ